MIFAQKLRISMLKRKNTILIKRKACTEKFKHSEGMASLEKEIEEKGVNVQTATERFKDSEDMASPQKETGGNGVNVETAVEKYTSSEEGTSVSGGGIMQETTEVFIRA